MVEKSQLQTNNLKIENKDQEDPIMDENDRNKKTKIPKNAMNNVLWKYKGNWNTQSNKNEIFTQKVLQKTTRTTYTNSNKINLHAPKIQKTNRVLIFWKNMWSRWGGLDPCTINVICLRFEEQRKRHRKFQRNSHISLLTCSHNLVSQTWSMTFKSPAVKQGKGTH